jgi:hypothetical protein
MFEIINNNNFLDNSKPKLMLLINYGLGDLINMAGAIRYYSQTYKVTITCDKKNLSNAYILFDDLNDLSFLVTNELTIIYVNDLSYYFNDYQEIKVTGCHDIKFNLTNIPYSFYQTLKLDTNIMRKYFVVKKIQNNNFIKIKDYKYIFIHNQASNYNGNINLNTDKLIICPDKNYYESNSEKYELAQLFLNLPFFEYIDIIENADEIHVVDSSFFCISLQLNLTAIIKCCYFRYVINTDLDKTYQYIPTNELTNRNKQLIMKGKIGKK